MLLFALAPPAAAAAETVVPSALESPKDCELEGPAGRFSMRIHPDGLVEVTEAGAPVFFSISGEGRRVSGELHAGERISAWPVARLTAEAKRTGFSLRMEAEAWAFTLRADEVRRKGLPLLCEGGLQARLKSGERIDSVFENRRRGYRLAGGPKDVWPGRLLQVPRREEVPVELPPEAPLVAMRRREIVPGFEATQETTSAWQTVPLPVLVWEVFRPPDVSP